MPRKVCHVVAVANVAFCAFLLPAFYDSAAVVCVYVCVSVSASVSVCERVIVTCIQVDLLRFICIVNPLFPVPQPLHIGNLVPRQCHIISYPFPAAKNTNHTLM